MFIYLDESGDLGFDFVRKRPSKKFVITVLVCENDAIIKGFKKAVRRTIRNKLAKSTDRVQELKGTSTALPIKDYFLRNVPQQGWGVYSVILNKERVYDHLKSKIGRKKLYNYLARFLLKRIAVPPETNAVNLFIDRSKTRQEIKDFTPTWNINWLDSSLLRCRLLSPTNNPKTTQGSRQSIFSAGEYLGNMN
jgi:hypothetical protein